MCGITRTIHLIYDTRYLCTRSRIDGIKAMNSRGISGGKQVIKFANTSNAVEFVYSIKRDDDFIVIQSVGKIYVFTVCHEDIYDRYCIFTHSHTLGRPKAGNH